MYSARAREVRDEFRTTCGRQNSTEWATFSPTFCAARGMNPGELDGLFAAYLRFPVTCFPREYLPEILGNDVANEERHRVGGVHLFGRTSWKHHLAISAIRRC